MSPKQNLNEDAEISDGEISVSSEQIRTVERMQRKSKEEKMDDDDLLNGPDVVDENELANAEKFLGSRNTSLTKEGMENDDGNGDGRRNEDMMMEEGEVRDESMSSLNSTSQQQNVIGIGSRHPRRSLFGGPPYPESYSKFNPSNAPSNGPIDFGGGMDISLLSGSQNSSTISANYQTPVMSAAKAIRTIENNNSRRRLLGKPYIRIELSDNGIGQSNSNTKRNVNWGPRTPPENENDNNNEAEETAEQRSDDSNSNVGNGTNSSTTVVPPTPNNSATNSGSSSSSTTLPSRRRRLSGTSRYDLIVKNVGEKRQKLQNANENGQNSANGSQKLNELLAKNVGKKRQKCQNVAENGQNSNENGKNSANGRNLGNLASGSGTSNDLFAKNGGEKRQKCQNVAENGRNSNENGKNSANGRNLGNLASGSGTSNDSFAKNGGEKRQKQRENVQESGRIVNENGRNLTNGQNKDKERIIKKVNGTTHQQRNRRGSGLNLQLVDLRQEQEDDEELEEGEDREEELEIIDQIESEETNEENENEMAQNSSAANLNESSSSNNHSWMYYDKKDKTTPNGMNGVGANRNQIIGGQQRQNGNVRNDEENAPPIIWITGFDRNVDVNALAVRMAEAGKIVKLTVLHLPTPCTVASVEYALGEEARHAISINNDRFWQGYEMKCAFEERIELVDNAQSEAPAPTQNGRNAMRPSNTSNRNIHTSTNLHNQSFPENRPNVRKPNERLNATFGGIGGQQQRGRNRIRSRSPVQMNRPRSRSLGNRMHLPNRPPQPPQNFNRNIRPLQAPQQNDGPSMNVPGRNSRRDQFEHQQNNSFRPRPPTNTNGHHNQQRQQQYWEEIVTPSPPTTSNLNHQSRIIRTPWLRANGIAGPSTSSSQNQPGTSNGSGRQNQRGEKRKMVEGPAVFFQR